MDGFLLSYLFVAAIALIGGIVEDVVMNESFYCKVVNNQFGKEAIALTVMTVISIACTIAMVKVVPKRMPKIFCILSIVCLIAMTALSMSCGIISRHNFEQYYNTYLDNAKNPDYEADYIEHYKSLCPSGVSNSACLKNELDFIWKRTGEAGITILGTYFVFLFVQTGIISHTFKSRKAKKEVVEEKRDTNASDPEEKKSESD